MKRDALVSSLYEAALEPKRWSDVLLELRSIADSQGAALMFGHPTGAQVGIEVGHSPESDADYARYYSALDPLIGYGFGKPAGTWLNDWRIVGARFSNTEYYNDFYRKHGWHACNALILHMEEAFWACVSFQRARGKPAFDHEIERNFAGLLPHLSLAFRLFRETESLRAASSLSALALESLDVALWAVDTTGKVMYSNQLAESSMARGETVTSMSGRLQILDGDHCAFQAAVQVATSALPKASWLRLSRGGQTMTVLPAPDSMQTMPRLALVMLRSRRSDGNVIAALQAIYRLTLREAEVACQVGKGIRPKEIADDLRLSTETVRGYLKAVYLKMGVRTQAELAHRLNTLLGVG